MHCREQQRHDKSSYPGKKEKLCAEAAQPVGHSTELTDNFPHVGTIEEKQLVLLLIMQMVRIGQSEKEKHCHTEKEGKYNMYMLHFIIATLVSVIRIPG